MNRDEDVLIVFPEGSFGASSVDSPLDAALRQIAVAATLNPEEEWAEKYGVDFENEAFLMHTYCWCEKDGCRWCSEDACGCPNPPAEHYLDGARVESWLEASEAILRRYRGRKAKQHRQALRAERNRRLVTVIPERRHACEPRGFMADRERGDKDSLSQRAPNFWHKATGLRVWWYKYIGRDTEVSMPTDDALLAAVLTSCMESLRLTATREVTPCA